MNKNYFTLERNQQCLEKIVFRTDEKVEFEDLMSMSYEEMKAYPRIEEFVVAVMESTKDLGGTQVIINLIDPDDVFIWGIIIGIYEEDYNFVFVDWQKDGKKYRYQEA